MNEAYESGTIILIEPIISNALEHMVCMCVCSIGEAISLTPQYVSREAELHN